MPPFRNSLLPSASMNCRDWMTPSGDVTGSTKLPRLMRRPNDLICLRTRYGWLSFAGGDDSQMDAARSRASARIFSCSASRWRLVSSMRWAYSRRSSGVNSCSDLLHQLPLMSCFQLPNAPAGTPSPCRTYQPLLLRGLSPSSWTRCSLPSSMMSSCVCSPAAAIASRNCSIGLIICRPLRWWCTAAACRGLPWRWPMRRRHAL